MLLTRNLKEENRPPKKIQAVPNEMNTNINLVRVPHIRRTNAAGCSRLVMINIYTYLQRIPKESTNGNGLKSHMKSSSATSAPWKEKQMHIDIHPIAFKRETPNSNQLP